MLPCGLATIVIWANRKPASRDQQRIPSVTLGCDTRFLVKKQVNIYKFTRHLVDLF